MARRLTDLVIREVSSVDKGAGRGVKILLMKREDEYWKRDFSQDERDAAASSGAALPDGSFPIKTVADLRNAIQAIGRASDPAKVKAHIKSRAHALGQSDLIPDTWKRDTDGVGALASSVESILGDEAVNKTESLRETFDQFLDYLADHGVIKKDTDMALPKDEIELKKAIDDAVAAAVKKATDDTAAALKKVSDENRLLKMTDECKAYMKELTADEADKFKAMTAEEQDAHMKKNPLSKREPDPEIAKRDAEIADLKKKMDALAKDNTVRAEREDIESFKKRAVAAGLKEEDGEVMRKAYKGDAAAQIELDKRFTTLTKALAETQRTGRIFSEFGTALAKGGDAYAMLTAKADELRKADSKLSKDQAFTKVYTDPANAELVQQHKQETAPKAAA